MPSIPENVHQLVQPREVRDVRSMNVSRPPQLPHHVAGQVLRYKLLIVDAGRQGRARALLEEIRARFPDASQASDPSEVITGLSHMTLHLDQQIRGYFLAWELYGLDEGLLAAASDAFEEQHRAGVLFLGTAGILYLASGDWSRDVHVITSELGRIATEWGEATSVLGHDVRLVIHTAEDFGTEVVGSRVITGPSDGVALLRALMREVLHAAASG
jgi:hypothetical protein